MIQRKVHHHPAQDPEGDRGDAAKTTKVRTLQSCLIEIRADAGKHYTHEATVLCISH
jgi:hypothetical protein